MAKKNEIVEEFAEALEKFAKRETQFALQRGAKERPPLASAAEVKRRADLLLRAFEERPEQLHLYALHLGVVVAAIVYCGNDVVDDPQLDFEFRDDAVGEEKEDKTLQQAKRDEKATQMVEEALAPA